MATYLRAHFDGQSIILDEPATLTPGQTLRVLVEPATDSLASPGETKLFGACKGMFVMGGDFNDPLDCFADYRE
ncbi:hypothetical protein Pla175_39740 [Pirellulimonas nuda]|uniref:DUF2281 domain-containing protein n=1 Tax=Pirellulimonas nuda TaxID=2528009 RepID=A0A518DGG3_9BACT|nr:DUF2281 domain-containing protein [Pirellulimonas nuda]QDU90567.1 hypothetical protein Pla175_39740 [Pirellulimonas nuda]